MGSAVPAAMGMGMGMGMGWSMAGDSSAISVGTAAISVKLTARRFLRTSRANERHRSAGAGASFLSCSP
jgi:hypothetical protein